MRRLILGSLLASVAALPAAAQFEGTITMKTMGQGDATYMIKGDKVAFTTQSPMAQGVEVRGIIDFPNHKMVMVMPATGPMAAMTAMPGMADAKGFTMTIDMNGAAANGPTPTVKDLGTSETIAGYKCEDFEVTDGKNVTKVCMSQELGKFALASGGMGRRGGGAGAAWTRAFGDKIGMPLKVWNDGKVSMEVTAVSKGSVPESMFKVPDGYKEMPMMGGMGRGPGL